MSCIDEIRARTVAHADYPNCAIVFADRAYLLDLVERAVRILLAMDADYPPIHDAAQWLRDARGDTP